MLKEALKQFLQKSKLISLLIIGTITWSWTMVKSGWFYANLGTNGSGLGFWGANGHDGMVHIALAESLGRGTLAMPFFAGSTIQNYHIGFDLILALLHKVTLIPTANLYFQILPPIVAFSIGSLTYCFTKLYSGSKTAAIWAIFFVYFGGSFGWVVGKGESAFWSQQAVSSLINPPFALSLVLLLLGLIILLKLEERITVLNFIFVTIIFGCLTEVKTYAGILALGALFVSAIYSLIFYKKQLLIRVFAGSILLALILYIPLNLNASSLLVFQPFWFLETMMGLVDRLNYPRFYSAMLNYKSGHNYFKAIPAYIIAFVIFWAGNMGTRLVKEFTVFKRIKNIRNLKLIEVFMISVILAGGLIPMLFLQKGTPWNTIQFFYYSIFFSSIFAGIMLSQIKNKIFLGLIVLATIPTTIITLKEVYIPTRPPAMLSKDELSALRFLADKPDGIVLTKPFDEFESKAAENDPPRPLYLYASTAYVSAFSSHQTFFDDEINLDISGYGWQARKSDVLTWYGSHDNDARRKFLTDNKIKYIYWIKEGQPPLDLGKLSLAKIYENSLITIYQVE